MGFLFLQNHTQSLQNVGKSSLYHASKTEEFDLSPYEIRKESVDSLFCKWWPLDGASGTYLVFQSGTHG